MKGLTSSISRSSSSSRLRLLSPPVTCHNSFIFPLSVSHFVRSLRYIPGRVRTFRSSSQFTPDRPRLPVGCSLSGRIVFCLYISRPGPSGLLSFVLVNLPSIPPRPPLSSALRCVRLASIAPVTATVDKPSVLFLASCNRTPARKSCSTTAILRLSGHAEVWHSHNALARVYNGVSDSAFKQGL